MRRTTPRAPARLDGLADQSGFALIEVMVSAVLVVVLATATLSIIERSGASAAGNRQRTTAVSLAQADQDTMRQSPITSLLNLHTSVDKKIAGTTYTIKSDAVWLRDAGGRVTCSSNSARAEYVKITSAVNWVGHTAPVVLESYMSPGVAGVQKGALTVRLKTDLGTGTPGIPVSVAGGPSGVTDSDGCAVLANVTPGANTVSWGTNGSGYVDRNGITVVSESVSIATGQTAQIERLYDKSAQVAVRFRDENNADVNWTSASMVHASITNPTTGVRTFLNGATGFAKQTTAVNLFPFVAPYSAYAGSCAGNAPTTWLSSASMPTVAPLAGTSNSTVDVKLPTAAVYVSGAGATPPAVGGAAIGVKVAPVATYAKMAGCTESIPRANAITTNPTNPTNPAAAPNAGFAFVNLPYGEWTVCADDGTHFATGVLRNTPVGTTPAADAPTQDVPYATLQTMTGVANMPSVNVKLNSSTWSNGKCA
jgi:type II secretory pathway pseudopilin PulG